jgi:hypothetical protein
MKAKPGYQHKEPVVSLVERGGQVRSFHIARVASENLKQVLHKNVAPEAYVMTSILNAYHKATVGFASHAMVNYTVGEYVRNHVHTNTVEGVFSIFKLSLASICIEISPSTTYATIIVPHSKSTTTAEWTRRWPGSSASG